MIEIVNLIKLIRESDYVLLDASFFPSNRRYDKSLSVVGNTQELELFRPEIENSLEQWYWLNKNIISNPRVYTIPEVVEELKSFRDILQTAHRRCSKFKTSKAQSLNRKRRYKIEPWTRDFENEGEETSSRSNILYKPMVGLTLLDRYGIQVNNAIKKIKQYTPLGYELPKLTEDISATDYHLVGAGIEHLITHPNKKTCIFTGDRHLVEILDKFLDQNPSLPPGEVGVYRFTPGLFYTNGIALLREAVISESELYVRLQRA
jgi:hypothetical protein